MKTIIKWTGMGIFAALISLSAASAGEVTHRRVEGLVKFELRHSLITQNYCWNQPCHQSKPYWVLVLHQREVSYELNQPLAEGNAKAPRYAELNGIRVHAGVWVSIEGLVESVGNNLGLITEVHFVDLPVQDPNNQTRFPGWSCESSSFPLGFYAVNVWRIQDSEVYQLRVKLVHGQLTNDVTSINHMQISRQGGDVHYFGADNLHRASLLIHQSGNPLLTSPARLSLEQLHAGPFAIDLKCVPLRSFPAQS